jgi:hypothetical protein
MLLDHLPDVLEPSGGRDRPPELPVESPVVLAQADQTHTALPPFVDAGSHDGIVADVHAWQVDQAVERKEPAQRT